MSKTRLMAAATTAVAGLLLTGCGSASPGIAAQVGDEELTVGHVDTVAANYCEAISEQLSSEGNAVPMGFVRQYVVQALTVRSQAIQLGDEYGVEPGSAYLNDVAQRQGTAGTLPEDVRSDFIDIESTSALVQDIAAQVGEIVLADSGVDDPSVEEAAQAGIDVFTQWPDTHGIDIDPRYGVASVDGVLTPVDTNTSVAVSDTAKAGTVTEPDPALADSLPLVHRCG